MTRRTKTPIPPNAAMRIQELAPLARLARRQHGPEDPKVKASMELTLLVKDLYEQGCSIPQMADLAEVTYHSISARIKNG